MIWNIPRFRKNRRQNGKVATATIDETIDETTASWHLAEPEKHIGHRGDYGYLSFPIIKVDVPDEECYLEKRLKPVVKKGNFTVVLSYTENGIPVITTPTIDTYPMIANRELLNETYPSVSGEMGPDLFGENIETATEEDPNSAVLGFYPIGMRNNLGKPEEALEYHRRLLANTDVSVEAGNKIQTGLNTILETVAEHYQRIEDVLKGERDSSTNETFTPSPEIPMMCTINYI